jgi:hypothetical protein
MQLFTCSNCRQLLYFENTLCVRCGSALGYLSDEITLSPLVAAQGGLWQAAGVPERSYRSCANGAMAVCNWMIPADTDATVCRACALNHVIPDLSKGDNLERWQTLELAKHKLVYALIKMGLPVVPKSADPVSGLGFVFVAHSDDPGEEGLPTKTGHMDGLITINISEADDAQREYQRKMMGEPYRTVLGHFRHEIGHYYFDRLIDKTLAQDTFRQLFGDETVDYGDALARHYENGPVVHWPDHHVSAYASAHAHEDFAETWAHYMHIVDTLETAHSFGVQVSAGGFDDPALSMQADFNPYQEPDFGRILKAWLPLTYALNSLNRSMGHLDLYPFVLPTAVEAKLAFIHQVVRGTSSQPTA